jgi:predicted DNA-binding transcriptional regulator YafY
MTVTSHARIQRLRRLEALLPRAIAAPGACPDGGRLLEILGDTYGSGSESTRQRTLQRDLVELIRQGRVEALKVGGRSSRYRRLGDEADDDPLVWQYTLQQVRDLIAETVPARRLDRLWQRLLSELDAPLLDEQRLRMVSDTLRLRPVELYPDVLQAVITALAQHCVLQVLYEKANGERSEVRLHPHAVVQRGPIPYLFALKNDDADMMRLYALHRMIRAQALTASPARRLDGFDLDESIALGKADFGQGRRIDLELRVRGYLATLLSVCPLSDEQQLQDEPEGSPYLLRVKACLPSTGQLLRWLLGAGDNLEVLAPVELRQVLAVQAEKMAAIYRAGTS